MKEKILAKLQELRNDDLAAMEFAAGRSEAMIKAYCNIREIPEELLSCFRTELDRHRRMDW